ncbi:hypothetical protein GGR56DRAFT_673254 [Xylariaceae sp. FL0804]|nr:hypothetical protein GGR56DRAFT_673254 [Xylariaceae sp. FL0804]
MTEGVSSTEDAAAARATEQARLRKQRREAKIKAGGAARLDKITGLGGGIPREPSTQSTPPPAEPPSSAPASSTPDSQAHDDPAEVDISQHYYAPPSASAAAAARRSPFADDRPPMTMMPGMDGAEGGGDDQQDPMMQMLSKMMAAGGMPPGGGGGGGGAPGANPFAGSPLEGLFNAGGPFGGQAGSGGPPGAAAAPPPPPGGTDIWRVLHALLALGLGLYLALTTTFSGTLAQREGGFLDKTSSSSSSSSSSSPSTASSSGSSIEHSRAQFFRVFGSAEAALLAARYLLGATSAGAGPPGGWIASVANLVLPPRAAGYARHALRYRQIFLTVRNDALVCVFVLGICAMLRS